MRLLASYSRSVWLTLALAACCGAFALHLLRETSRGNAEIERNNRILADLDRMMNVFSAPGPDAEKVFRNLESTLDGNAPALETSRKDLMTASQAIARIMQHRRRLREPLNEEEQAHLYWAMEDEALRGAEAIQSVTARVRQEQLTNASQVLSQSRLLMIMVGLLAGVVGLLIVQLRLHSRQLGRQKRVETALRTSQARFRELFDNVLEGVYQTWPNGQILTANAALVNMLGYASEDELKEHTTATELYEDPSIRAGFLNRLEQDGEIRNLELVLRRKDGRRITVLENARTVRDEHGGLLFYEGTLTDITHLKRIENELARARDQAIEASQLKSEFLANVSHEVRTPLNGVIGMTGLLLDTDLSPEQREYALAARRSAQFLLGILNDILDFSKIEAGRLELESIHFALRPCVEDVLDMLTEQAESRNIELVSDIGDDVPDFLVGDPKRLRQVITNLAGNALKFTHDGHVAVRVSASESSGESVVLQFDVVDTGIGITEEQMSRIFEPFCQGDGSTTRRYGGTGLGLSISRRIVELMHGSIGVTSEEGSGSTFRFSARFGIARAASWQPGPSLDGVRLFLCGCEGATREMIEKHAAAWGMDVRHAGSLAEIAPGGGPAVVLMEADVWEQATESPHPVFLLTNFGRRPAASEAVNGAVAGIVTRPVRLKRLRMELARAAGVSLPSAKARAHRVLIAEDHAVNQMVARRLVEKLGCETALVASGLEAVEAVANGDFSLVLMDCQMPEMDGFAATVEIRRRENGKGRLPIVAMTAHALKGDRERCISAGMDDYVAKPVNAEELAAVLKRWLPARAEEPADSSFSHA